MRSMARPRGRWATAGSRSPGRFRIRATAGEQLEDEATPFAQSNRIGEAGLNYQRALGRWQLELNALLARKRYGSHVSSTHFDAQDVQDSVYTRDLEQDSGESILRATLSRDLARGRLETGAELAVNTLEGRARQTLDLGAGAFEIPLLNDNLTVKENRAEAFMGRSFDFGRWSLETRLAVEASELRFTGDTEQSVSLSYLKPLLQLTRSLGAHQLQLRMFRDVGQLDFTDFVSSVEISDDVISGGNPDLRPQTAWAAELIGDFRVANTALRARLFRHWLDDVNDLVPVTDGDRRIDSPGNIGAGSLLGTQIALRVPLTGLLPGGSLNVSGTIQDARARDPLTGARRDISDFVERQVKAELRQDLQASKLSWGISFLGESGISLYRVDEIDRKTKSSSLDLFVETGIFQAFKVRLAMISAMNDAENRVRVFYAPDRAGALTSIERGSRPPGHWWLLTLSGGF
jgi:hypothetical protein